MRKNARVKIGISTYNDRGFLELILQSIDWYTFLDEKFDVVVCDDGSLQEYKNSTKELCARFGATYIEHEENLGIPATWNHLTLSLNNDAEIIVLLNNDLLMPPDWLRVAVHFLDANKDNPHVGSCFWNPVNQVPMEAMRGWLPTLNHTTFVTTDRLTGNQRDFIGSSPMNQRVGENQGLGRVMCPCGCCFAFRREVFEEVGLFDERLKSFHEESDWGTRCASKGRASFGFAYPRPYHGVGQTFGANPELKSGNRMAASRSLYRQIWNVPEEVGPHDYFDYVNKQLMPSIPTTKLKYLRPNYNVEADEITRASDSAKIMVPHLEELEEEF